MTYAELKADRNDLMRECERMRVFLYKIHGLIQYWNWRDDGDEPGVVLPAVREAGKATVDPK